jgi:hypothetical protein
MQTKQTSLPIQLGDAVEHRGIVIAPLFPRQQPRGEYVTVEEAIPLGFRVTELDIAGAVPELRVQNPLEKNVLLYDGEELIGAKQNRILNVTVLVGAATETTIPVSCVEEGRWSAGPTAFDASPNAAYPELRRRKAEVLSAAPLARGIAQSEVWDAIRAKDVTHGSESPTRAQADIFRKREDDLAALRAAFPIVAGQSGALFALGGRMCFDYASRPEAFARLYPKLLDGYLLDALEGLDGQPSAEPKLTAFLCDAASANRSRRPSAGLGQDIRLRGKRLVGSGLEFDEELVQLCAFTSDGTRSAPTRIARPSRRR